MFWVSPVGLAYKRWSLFQPYGNSTCCSARHFYDDDKPIPDERVCEREKAWRDYVRLRDCNPSYCLAIKETVLKKEGPESSSPGPQG